MRRTYKDITYTLTRSQRKSAGISIERDGQVVVRVPETLSDRQIEAVIERKRRWIYHHLAQWRDLNARQVGASPSTAKDFCISAARTG